MNTRQDCFSLSIVFLIVVTFIVSVLAQNVQLTSVTNLSSNISQLRISVNESASKAEDSVSNSHAIHQDQNAEQHGTQLR